MFFSGSMTIGSSYQTKSILPADAANGCAYADVM